MLSLEALSPSAISKIATQNRGPLPLRDPCGWFSRTGSKQSLLQWATMSKIATQKRGESIPFLLAMTVAGRWFSRSESKQSLSMDDNEQDCHSKIYVQTQNSASPTIINFMPIISGEILEVRLESDGSQSGRILLSQALRIEPGQYLLVDAFRTGNAPPQAVFVLGGADRELELAAPMPSDWVVGTQLSIRGPLGTGFHLPPSPAADRTDASAGWRCCPIWFGRPSGPPAVSGRSAAAQSAFTGAKLGGLHRPGCSVGNGGGPCRSPGTL
jgi:hypothetical protein